MDSVNQSGRKATFCEQKVAKKLYDAGPWALSGTKPMAQHKQKFFAPLFFKKAATFLKETPA
jgi:hypothetical protein